MPPFDLGLQEEAGVSLLILDVKVRDENGLPVPGLTLDDFEVSINGRLWPLEAVDDFCNCGASAGQDPQQSARGGSLAGKTVAMGMEAREGSGPVAGDMSGLTGSEPSGSVAGAGADTDDSVDVVMDKKATPERAIPQHFVVYLDFSSFNEKGRVDAQRHVHHWIQEGMRPEDRVMLAGFSTAAGLVEITPFTSDRTVLLAGLEAAFADKAFIDTFSVSLRRRLTDCGKCFDLCILNSHAGELDVVAKCMMQCCYHYAKQEASQGRRGLEALELFISSLDEIGGPKQVLYFNQNNMIYPEKVYAGLGSSTPGVRSMYAWSIQDHMKLLDSVAATATANRTVINVATMPSVVYEAARNLGWNIADYTGGIASGSRFDVDATLGRVGRECCMYRLSVRVPEDPPRRILRAMVTVRGRTLKSGYRVRFYTPQERWFRQARLALMTTSRSPDSQVQLGLLPVARRRGEWSMEAQVSFALQDLELIPAANNRTGRWRVGALLQREDGHKAWEMLTLAQATLQGTGGTGLEAFHSRTLADLKPGEYRLQAFVEDAVVNRFWSREITLVLPAGGKDDVEEPWLSRPFPACRINARLDLDLLPVTNKPPVSSAVGAPAVGFVPKNPADVVAGTTLEFRTVLCPGPAGGAAPPTISILLQDERPLVRLPEPVVESAGECVALTDTVDTMPLMPGDYTYRLILNRGEEEPLLREVALTIRPGAELDTSGTPGAE